MLIPPLTNIIMNDGSRHFLCLPEKLSPRQLLLHIDGFDGAVLSEYLLGGTESWIDFKYREHDFSINNRPGDFLFFVKDPQCAGDILQQVAVYFVKLLV